MTVVDTTRLAVLIDADNSTASVTKELLEEIATPEPFVQDTNTGDRPRRAAADGHHQHIQGRGLVAPR
jgi:hypothetical protein